LVTDFTIANTLCATAMNGQLTNPDYYEDIRAEDKERKYKVTIGNGHSIFIPFVVTALGKWHRTALSFYKKIATHNITRKGLVRIFFFVEKGQHLLMTNDSKSSTLTRTIIGLQSLCPCHRACTGTRFLLDKTYIDASDGSYRTEPDGHTAS
jgi:hypothetical protein